MKPVIVGEAPSPSATRPVQPLFPFPEHSTGARLWRMTGLSRPEYIEAFHRMYLLSQYDDRYFESDARWAAWNLISSRLLDGRAVVLLGQRVWLAFGGREDVEPLVWYRGSVPAFKPACVAMLPCPDFKSPSVKTQWYDNEHQAGAAINFMRLFAEGDCPDWSQE